MSTRLGAIALAISAEANGATERMAKAAMQNAVFHSAPGKAFKKGSGFAREDAYSEKLEGQVSGAVEAALTEIGFSKVSIEAGRYVAAPNAAAKAKHDVLVAAGVPEAKIREIVPEYFPASSEETNAEATEEAVG